MARFKPLSYLVPCPICGEYKLLSNRSYFHLSIRNAPCKKCGAKQAKRKTNLERFWNKVEISEPKDCWIWKGTINELGYGCFHIANSHKRTSKAYRYIYEIFFGKVPEGLELDHLCRNRACVNPFHLEAVTHKENIRRSMDINDIGLVNRSKTLCPKGHSYDINNTYTSPKGKRACRICRRISQDKALLKRKGILSVQKLG